MMPMAPNMPPPMSMIDVPARKGWPGGPVSSVHNDEDLQHTVDAFRNTICLLRKDGDLD